MPKISVIVPVYKVEPYLRRCVDSILGQTFSDFELILVDDGSPDNCPAICDQYARQDPRVHVIHQKNGGLSAGRNAGIDWVFANSDSQWLTFVDSDDWVHSEMLERLYHAVLDSNVKISACRFQKTAGNVLNCENEQFEEHILSSADFYMFHNTFATIACAKLYSKSLFSDIRYPVGKIHEDEFITYQILFKSKNVTMLDTPMYFYYENQESITKSKWTPKRMDVFEAFEEQFHFFSQPDYRDILKMRAKKHLIAYAMQIGEIDKKSYPEYPNRLRRMMRKSMNKYRDFHICTIKNDIWLYEVAYPHVMHFYWYWKALCRKLHLR